MINNMTGESASFTTPLISNCFRHKIRFSLAFIGLLVALVLPQKAWVAETSTIDSTCGLSSFKKSHSYIVEAWAVPDSWFDVGEPLRFQMRVSTPSYMNVFHVSTSCKITRLLDDHQMAATEILDFPLPASGIQIIVKPPSGDEGFYFIATRGELDFLSRSDIISESAGMASLDLNPEQFFRRLRDALGRINPADWSTTTLFTSVVSH